MIALVIAQGVSPGMEALNERYPSPLLPLVDRPFIQHVVEFLVEGGITQFQFVLSHLPRKIENFLGDGSRWGSAFRFHLARDPMHPYDMLKTVRLGEDAGPLLLVHADRLPQVDLAQTRPKTGPVEPILFFSSTERDDSGSTTADLDERNWTGWAWLPAGFLETLPGDLDEETLEDYLVSMAHGRGSRVQAPEVLDIRSYEGILAAHRLVLGRQFQGLFLSGREADPSIWLSRNVSLHPTATLIPPVYICRNCRIGKGTRLGPDAVIGKDSVLDSGCTVAASVVFPGSYVGERLELADVIVDKNCLINVRFGAAVSISEDFILGGTKGPGIGHWLAGILSQAAAALLFLVLWPLLLATAFVLRVGRPGPLVFRKEALRLPAPTDPAQWRTFTLLSFAQDGNNAEKGRGGALRHFLLRFLPGLISVAKGNLRIIGVSPRTEEDVEALSRDWRALYLKTKAGLVTEAYVNYGDEPTEDERYTAEAFYSVASGIGHDLKLFFAYLSRVLKGFAPSTKARP